LRNAFTYSWPTLKERLGNYIIETDQAKNCYLYLSETSIGVLDLFLYKSASEIAYSMFIVLFLQLYQVISYYFFFCFSVLCLSFYDNNNYYVCSLHARSIVDSQ